MFIVCFLFPERNLRDESTHRGYFRVGAFSRLRLLLAGEEFHPAGSDSLHEVVDVLLLPVVVVTLTVD